MATVQRTVMSAGFLDPHIQRIFQDLNEPQNHQTIVRLLVASIRRGSGVPIPGEFADNLMSAAFIALSPQWLHQEATGIVNKILALLHGSDRDPTHYVYIERRVEILLGELAATLPADYAAEVRRGGALFPIRFDVFSAVEPRILDALLWWGSRYAPFCLLFIYVVPGALILMCIQFARTTWATLGVGLPCLVSGVAFYTVARTVPDSAFAAARGVMTRTVPRELSWIGGHVEALLRDAFTRADRIALACTLSGIVLTAVGVLVAYLIIRSSGPTRNQSQL